MAERYIAQHHIQGVYAWNVRDGLSGDIRLHCPLCREKSYKPGKHPGDEHGYLKGSPDRWLLDAM